MSWNKIGLFALAPAVAAGIFMLYVPHLPERIGTVVHADACDAAHEGIQAKVDCWLGRPLSIVDAGSLTAGFRAFTYLYETYPAFASTGCHRYAHKVGDAAYYNFMLAKGLALEEVEFPQSTTACGYGFFHGFIEHLVQNDPDEKNVVQNCEYLRETYAKNMRDIGTICYHASGHGFMQTQADALPDAMWGNPGLMVKQPLEACERLPTNGQEIEDCREGVFNVLVDWMETKDFGLSFDLDDPLALCSRVAAGWQYACYYELGQNLGKITGGSPLRAAAFSASIRDTELRRMTFGVMVAGMMQSKTALDEYRELLGECTAIEEAVLYETCVVSSANGMMEHGVPGEEYAKVLDLCADARLTERDGDAACYRALGQRLARFYPPGKVASICGSFPSAYRDSCVAEI
jgi:hypothetical protein